MANAATVNLVKTSDDQFEATFKVSKQDLKEIGEAIKKYSMFLKLSKLGPITTELAKLIDKV